jgi:sugar lactone lactonase YvrE
VNKSISLGIALASSLSVFMGIPPVVAAEMRVVSDQAVTGFVHPESVACDPRGKVLYVSQFGSELKPTLKDGKGKISRVSLTGQVLEDTFLPPAGEVLHKPKGIWVEGDRLWVTDIDVVWVFDLMSRRGRKAALPGVKFANDPTVRSNVLFVSDNRADQLFRVEPADFLDLKGQPKTTVMFSGRSIHPNGLYPAADGSLLMVGFKSAQEAKGIYTFGPSGEIKPLSGELGRLDGVYQMADGSLLITDWNSGSLARWSAKAGMQKLVSGFTGPADFCVVPEPKGLLVIVPDLVKSELRLIGLAH